MQAHKVYFWQRAPALRLLLPFIMGIAAQWYLSFSVTPLWLAVAMVIILFTVYAMLPVTQQFRWRAVNGIVVHLLLAAAGMLLVYYNNITHSKQWVGKQYTAGDVVAATLQEPLVEKANSYKALAGVTNIYRNGQVVPATGNIIIYFKKEGLENLQYGTEVLFNKPMQAIKNAGNPGGFNYQQYSLFAGTTHQVYLTPADFIIASKENKHWAKSALFHLRNNIITILKTHITGDKEKGLAEALLIGYKDDLDKTLYQSYANTGVVHIIAISGLHVGLIYAILLLLTKPLQRKKLIGLRFLILIFSLWVFAFLAGAQPSVLRSAVMFSFIALATVINRQTAVYNTLALSAFLLLCYNPFWLWDVGFQLSYMAVLSIMIFFKPIYNWFYFTNKLVDFLWKSIAVTLAAQLLTTPLSLYHFHQFPLLFLFTNIVAVPLSSLILMGEILLCAFYFIHPLANAIGAIATRLIQWMNEYVESMNSITFAVWNGISITSLQTVLLLVFIVGISIWLLEKKQSAFWLSLMVLLLFTALRTFSFIHAGAQNKMVVYNIPKHQAIDIFNGRNCTYIGDAAVQQDAFLNSYNLRPARTLYRAKQSTTTTAKAFTIGNKKIMIVEAPVANTTFSKPHVDVLILSKNPKLYISSLQAAFDIGFIIADASVPAWKAARWQHDCTALNIPFYSVAQKGAFVMNF